MTTYENEIRELTKALINVDVLESGQGQIITFPVEIFTGAGLYAKVHWHKTEHKEAFHKIMGEEYNADVTYTHDHRKDKMNIFIQKKFFPQKKKVVVVEGKVWTPDGEENEFIGVFSNGEKATEYTKTLKGYVGFHMTTTVLDPE